MPQNLSQKEEKESNDADLNVAENSLEASDEDQDSNEKEDSDQKEVDGDPILAKNNQKKLF